MRSKVVFLIMVLCSILSIQAQEVRWKLGFEYFFDNLEYKKSSFTDAQTMHGIWLQPLGGITWDTAHTLYGGLNLLKIPGTEEVVDKAELVLYYQYETDHVLFRAGSFSSNEVLHNYSDFFYSDSVSNFMPLMQGLFWQIGGEQNFLNLWLDWTGYATPETRESFFLGSSGKVTKGIFFADFQSYLFHYANTLTAIPQYGVSEHMQLMASAGIAYESENRLKGLLSVGILAGKERDRKADISYTPMGFVARADAEFWGIGTKNTFYRGDKRMRLYPEYGTELYWGNPFLQGNTYLQIKWYVNVMETERVSARLNCNLHFSEGNLLFEQALNVSLSIDNFSKLGKRTARYPWMQFFQ